MAKKKPSRKSKKQVASKPSTANILKSEWLSRRPVLKFVLFFGLCMAAFYALYLSGFFTKNIMDPVVNTYAWISSGILKVLGQSTHATADVIASSKFSLSIKGGCDALEAMALLVSAIVAFPISFKHKWQGILAGVGFLFLMNIIRIVSLFVIGVYWEPAFELFHLDIWQVVFIILALICWVIWVRWAFKKENLNDSQGAKPATA